METYEPPVDQLLRIGKELAYRKEAWDVYLGLGIGPESIPDLIRMAIDQDLDQAESESDEVWAPVHAWRVLAVLEAKAAIPTLVSIFANQAEDDIDDWITEELPKVFAKIGPAAIPELKRLIEDSSSKDHAREHAAQSLVEIVDQHPETREPVVAILTQLIERAQWHAPEFNGWIVAGLLDLEAEESAEVIKRAYEDGFVDESICGSWYHVFFQLELAGEPPPRPEGREGFAPYLDFDDAFGDEFDDDEDDDFNDDPDPSLRPPPVSWQPIDLKTPDERKDRNKARQKLEKKLKGKGKGKGGKGR